MTVHELPNTFEMVTPRPPRYSLGLSVLVVIGLSVSGWAAIGIAINLIF